MQNSVETPIGAAAIQNIEGGAHNTTIVLIERADRGDNEEQG